MNRATSVTDSELPTLQLLARELAEAEAPELSSLDRIAALAGEIAARCRDGARRELLEQLSAGAQGMFQVAGDDVASRLSGSSLDELSALGVLLDEAGAARAAFAGVDADLMAARERGDYAAMAPLALEADKHKTALAAASGEFASRLGLEASPAMPMLAASAPPRTVEEPAVVEAALEPAALDEPSYLGSLGALTEDEDVSEDVGAVLTNSAQRPPSQSERRRIRDLIRQVRTSPDDAA
ncbi:MAG TPA: hypothetical protein VKQ73_00840 [Stellaceae bacterium]|nr:hypothetical protein [Stellaceae bacterium]